MYKPDTPDAHYKRASTVTVTQTADMVNQMIQVSWTGFTPSSAQLYDPTSTDYPVMVAECNTAQPVNPSQCYGATQSGEPSTLGANGPSNTAYSTTAANGTGQADIEVYTGIQNQFLGCDARHGCSIVVVPSQGGNSLNGGKPACADHSADSQGTDLGQYAFTPLNGTPNGLCSWRQRIVIPLRFAPTPNGCPFRAADFTAGGSPMLARAMSQWQTGICTGGSPISVQYNSSINENEARNDLESGLNDVAFTTQPLTGTGRHPFTYAPVAVSAVAVAYWADNAVTGLPFTNVRLDPRLVAKLLTTSYQFTGDGCPKPRNYPFGCDNAVDGNPVNLYADPEFRQLNPGVWRNAADPDGFQVPTVVSGDSDMTWTTTSWIAADKNASAFLSGSFDPWGMHVNTGYLGLKYPTDAFTTQDPYFPLAQRYSPTYPLSSVAQYQAQNTEPGTSDQKDPLGNYEDLPVLAPGQRDLYAIVDEADAADFLFPAAALRNHEGRYVRPTFASMTAAVKSMKAGPGGVLAADPRSKDPNAYPLTMVVDAVVPTGGVSAAKAAKIAQFLDFAAGAGQRQGTSPGQLPPGYLPLPASLRAQTLKAATEVLNQSGAVTQPTRSPTPSPTPTRPAPTPTPSTPSPPTAADIAVTFSTPNGTGTSWIVLALVIAGCFFAVAGPAAMALANPGARTAIGKVLGRIPIRWTIRRNP